MMNIPWRLDFDKRMGTSDTKLMALLSLLSSMGTKTVDDHFDFRRIGEIAQI
jgi:hypothetical protein